MTINMQGALPTKINYCIVISHIRVLEFDSLNNIVILLLSRMIAVYFLQTVAYSPINKALVTQCIYLGQSVVNIKHCADQ